MSGGPARTSIENAESDCLGKGVDVLDKQTKEQGSYLLSCPENLFST